MAFTRSILKLWRQLTFNMSLDYWAGSLLLALGILYAANLAWTAHAEEQNIHDCGSSSAVVTNVTAQFHIGYWRPGRGRFEVLARTPDGGIYNLRYADPSLATGDHIRIRLRCDEHDIPLSVAERIHE